MYVVEENHSHRIIASGFATISDALDASEELDLDETRGVFARRATDEEEGASA
jgi:hypothetical protein